jgi:hypothetical protein
MQGKSMMSTRLFWLGALALFVVPNVAVGQSCDLSELNCDQVKCNIHFTNLTGVNESTCKKGNSYSNAFTVKVKARDDKGKTLGNTLSILAGAKNTMNLSNSAKANVSSIKAGGKGNFTGGTLTCDDIKTVLKGSGKCKIYANREGYSDIAPYGYVYFDCSGGDVCTTY